MTRTVLFLFLGVFLLSACAPKPRLPINKTVSVEAGPNVNRYNESANPIVVRLYQLSSPTAFEEATFWQIFEDNSPDLAGVVLDKRSLSPLTPGETRLVAFDLVPDTLYLGAFAEFAEFDTQKFRDAVRIDAAILDEGVTVSVTASGISIQFRNPGTPEQQQAEEEKEAGDSGMIGNFFKKLVKPLKGIFEGLAGGEK